MIEPSDPDDPVPNQYSGMVNASSLFIKVSKHMEIQHFVTVESSLREMNLPTTSSADTARR